MKRLILPAAYSALVCVGLAGCNRGPTMVQATGTVTYKDAPVTSATVIFMSPEGKPATAVTDAQGKFTLSAAVGKNQVTVSKTAQQAQNGGMPSSPGMSGASGASAGTAEMDFDAVKRSMEAMQGSYEQNRDKPQPKSASEIPAQYASAETSDLSADVTEDPAANVFPFTLQDKK